VYYKRSWQQYENKGTWRIFYIYAVADPENWRGRGGGGGDIFLVNKKIKLIKSIKK
jgi:hypothetical protein